ncbi:hypothetical protein FDP41_005499 [Naegleria fowleri]|uniref:Uncharacterized protein n=1 Tax=Naegleria fowleri TaxID=5763 RepID=A0A6A5BQ07_NAEFO|nr:uncharacterized protein FDP41_005499 [Naegleria fowleri]KAF0975505.1 hypothetical protein FDP41_005499 [Naegleria fowleri]
MFTEGNNDHSSPPTYRLPNTTPNLQVRSHRSYTVNEDGEEQDPIFTNTNYSSTQVPPLLMNYPSSSFSATTLSHNNNNLDSHTFDHFTPIPMDLNTSSSTMGGTIHRKFESTSNNGDADDTKHKYAFRKKRSNSIASAVFGTCCGSTKRILVTFMILLSIVMVFYIVIYKRKLSLQQARIANAMNNPSSQQPTVQTGSNIMGTKVEKKSQDASQLGDDSVKNKSTKKKNRSGDEEEVDLDELLGIKKKTKKISSSDHVKKSKPSSKNKLSQKKKKLSKKPVINIPHKRRVVKQPKKPFKKPLNPEVKKEKEQEKIIKQAQEKAIDLSAPKSKHDDIIEKYLKMIDEEDISNEKKKKNTKAMNASKDPSSTTSTPPLIKQVAPVNNKKKNKDQNDIEQLKNHPLFKQDPQPFIPKIVEDFNQPIKKESKSNSNKQESVNQEEKPTQNVATTTTTSTTENNDNTRATTSSATTVSTTLSSPDASTTTGTTTTTTTQKEETTSQGDDSKKDKSKSEQVAPEKVEHDKFHDDNLVQVKDNKDSKQQQQQAEKKSQEASPVTKKKKKVETKPKKKLSKKPIPKKKNILRRKQKKRNVPKKKPIKKKKFKKIVKKKPNKLKKKPKRKVKKEIPKKRKSKAQKGNILSKRQNTKDDDLSNHPLFKEEPQTYTPPTEETADLSNKKPNNVDENLSSHPLFKEPPQKMVDQSDKKNDATQKDTEQVSKSMTSDKNNKGATEKESKDTGASKRQNTKDDDLSNHPLFKEEPQAFTPSKNDEKQEIASKKKDEKKSSSPTIPKVLSEKNIKEYLQKYKAYHGSLSGIEKTMNRKQAKKIIDYIDKHHNYD